jgi:hypothetical protein
MLNRNALALSAAALIFLGHAAAAAPRSIVTNWPDTRQFGLEGSPLYFTYKDRAEPGPGHDADISERFAAFRKQRARNGWFCENILHLSGGRSRAVFGPLTAGPSAFDIYCKGNCAGLKYAVASSSFQYMFHSGMRQDFVRIGFTGPTTYQNTNIGFTFFTGEPGVADAQMNVFLPDDTEVTVVYWRTSILSSLGGQDCSE